MGCFDILVLVCPKCGSLIEEQSKAGSCDLKRYHVGNVPPAIAGDLHNEPVVCEKCKASWRIWTQGVAVLVPDLGDEDED